MEEIFYSNGKLLITAEYLVLEGAKALALPTKFGQNLIVNNGKNKEIIWESYDCDGSIWFKEVILFSDISDEKKLEIESEKNTLIKILREAYFLNPNFIKKSEGYLIKTNLTFPKHWGLGTSSTLINNIAQWLKIDAFDLLKNSFGGSGYDIACARNNFPILYQLKDEKPIVKKVNFKPVFKDHLYFVYLNQKQSSKSAVLFYFNKKNDVSKIIPSINEITLTILKTQEFDVFTTQLNNHEKLMSKVLELPTVKENLFSDFDGGIKSLGAWGGDFALVFSKDNPSNYFIGKGFNTIMPYSEMIL